MLKSQSILKGFCSNFGFYISGPTLTKYIMPHQISTLIPQLQILKSQLLKMLLSILNRFESNFGFYISWPILSKYMIPHQISTNLNNFKSHLISTTSNADISVNFQFSIALKCWILHSMTYTICHHTKSQLIPPLQISTTSNAYISVNSQPILFIFWIIRLRTNPNKVSNTTPNINESHNFKYQNLNLSQLIGMLILVNSQLIWVKLLILNQPNP